MLTKPPLVLDTDLISSFAWVRRMDIIEKLYSKNMVVPAEVIYEISKRNVQHLKEALKNSVDAEHIDVVYINALGKDGQEFVSLMETGRLGSGEASVMAYVKHNTGTVSSNNLKDVLNYCRANTLPLLSTRAIIYDAIRKSIVSEAEAQTVWSEMIRKRRRLPCLTIKEVIEFYTTGPGASLALQKY